MSNGVLVGVDVRTGRQVERGTITLARCTRKVKSRLGLPRCARRGELLALRWPNVRDRPLLRST